VDETRGRAAASAKRGRDGRSARRGAGIAGTPATSKARAEDGDGERDARGETANGPGRGARGSSEKAQGREGAPRAPRGGEQAGRAVQRSCPAIRPSGARCHEPRTRAGPAPGGREEAEQATDGTREQSRHEKAKRRAPVTNATRRGAASGNGDMAQEQSGAASQGSGRHERAERATKRPQSRPSPGSRVEDREPDQTAEQAAQARTAKRQRRGARGGAPTGRDKQSRERTATRDVSDENGG